MKLLILSLMAFVPVIAQAQYNLIYAEKYQINRRVNLETTQKAQWEKDTTGPYEHYLTRKQYVAMTALGIGPMSDTFISTFRHHQDQKASALKLPSSLEVFNDWKKSDWMFWKRDKGVVIYPTGPIFIGPIARITVASSFHVYLEKKSETLLYVEVRPGQLNSQSIMGALPISYIERTRLIENYQNGTAYHLDMTTSTAQEAFSLLMDGNIDEVENLISLDAEDANEKIADTTFYRLSDFTQFGFSTPIFPLLSFTRRQNTQQTISTRADIWDQEEYEEELSSSSGKYDRALGYVRNEYQELSLVTKKQDSFNELNWSWNFETNLGNSQRTKRALKRLRKLVKCRNSCEYLLPTQKVSNGYIRSSYHIKISFEVLRSAIKNLRPAQQQKFNSLMEKTDTQSLKAAFKLIKQNKKVLNQILSKQCLPVEFEVAGEKMKRYKVLKQHCF